MISLVTGFEPFGEKRSISREQAANKQMEVASMELFSIAKGLFYGIEAVVEKFSKEREETSEGNCD